MRIGQIGGGQAFTGKCQALIEGLLGVPKVLLTTSCTHALEMAAHLLDVRPGDEVIVPAFTFVSTANAFVLRGARPIFVDVRPDTLNMDERRLERLVTARTRAIVPVHYAGVACEMSAIMEIAARRGVAVVEDNAHGFLGRYQGKPLGTFGALAALSFHETKNFTCGEGGALLLNDPRLVERAEILRDKGTDRARFLQGRVDKYTWVDVGSSYAPSDILAAFLCGQLERRTAIQRKRRRIWEFYHARLAAWAERSGVRVPTVPADREQAYHMYYLVLPSADARRRMIPHLERRGVASVFHYSPLHVSPMGRKFGGKPGDCPVAESLGARLLRLPFFNALTERAQESVVSALEAFEF